MAKGIPRPGGAIKRFFSEATAFDIVIAALAMVAGAQIAWRAYEENRPIQGYFSASVTGLIFVVTVSRLLYIYFSKERDRRPHDLEACLHAVHALLLSDQADGQDPGLRITIHVPFDHGNQLEQLIDYVGNKRGGQTARRRFPSRSGIIGKAYRERKYYFASRKNDDYESYVGELVAEWAYTEQDARARNPATKSWMAIPLENSENVEGVVYLDSTDREFFTEVRRGLILCACAGIANYVGQRYN